MYRSRGEEAAAYVWRGRSDIGTEYRGVNWLSVLLLEVEAVVTSAPILQ
jgi:hypothetical protein